MAERTPADTPEPGAAERRYSIYDRGGLIRDDMDLPTALDNLRFFDARFPNDAPHRLKVTIPCDADGTPDPAALADLMGGEEMTTYSDPDGDLIAGEFGWVTETEWFDDYVEPTPLRRRRWVCVEDVTGSYYPSGMVHLCQRCDGDGCARCDDTGEEPDPPSGFVPAVPQEGAEPCPD